MSLSPTLRNLILTALVALIAGYAGVRLGVAYLPTGQMAEEPYLRQTVFSVVKNDMQLSADQQRALEKIEDDYLRERARIRLEITAANAKLAKAIVEDMHFGPKTEEATLEEQEALGDLQRQTVLYTLAVREILTPEQQKVFDDRINRVLTAEAS